MKLYQPLAILLAFCLAGCSFGGTDQETTIPTVVTEAPTTVIPTTPSEVPTTAPETQATEPAQIETAPPQVIVQPEPGDEDFVKVKTYIPDIIVELRYATENNFTSQIIYDFSDVWLRYGTVKKLACVQGELKESGLSLKIWDGFRPPSAQFKLWNVCPNPTYVSDPNKGFSSHSRGNTVDITLVDTGGTELVMPTGFDDFSKLADRDYSDCTAEAASNALFLENLMIKQGFRPYSGEWWHFTDTQTYPVEEMFEPIAPATYYADCIEFIVLQTQPCTVSDEITKIRAGEQFQAVAQHGDYTFVEYNGLFGYVMRKNIQPSA